MGNYSRNTYNKAKAYTSVRLQQGVPLVDADWNEQADILRNQMTDSLDLSLGSGTPVGSYMILSGTGLTNDFNIKLGAFIVNGRLLQLDTTRYGTQPWTNASRAAQDGVAVIPPLTTPVGARIDMVYADIWEREINSQEDTNLVNPVIGVETSVRTRWEIAIRVSENANFLPVAPAGHFFMRVALLKRSAGVATIGSYDSSVTSGAVLDARPVLGTGWGTLNIAPCFFQINGFSPWRMVGGRPRAVRESNIAYGVVPVLLPHGARISTFTVRGYTSDSTQFWLTRSDLTNLGQSSPDYIYLLNQTVTGPTGGSSHYFSSWAMDDRDPVNRVDNRNYMYNFFAYATGSGTAEIYKITIDYTS